MIRVIVQSVLQIRRVFEIILALGLFAMAVRNITDPDVGWHLRTGQLMVQNHEISRTDPYSFTRAGSPWVDHEWLSQILMFEAYRVASWAGLMVVFAAMIAGALLLAYARSPGRPYIAGMVTVWGAIASAPTWGARPQMITFLLASVFLWILERSYERPKLLWWIPPLTLIWVNFHGGYALGLALLLLFLIGDLLDSAFNFGSWNQVRGHVVRMLSVLVMSLALVPVNPYGTAMYRYPFQTVGSRSITGYVTEWLSPNFHESMYLPTLLMMLGALILPALSPRRLRPRELLLLAVTMYAALLSARHVPIFVLVAIPVLAALAQSCVEAHGWARFFVPAQSAMSQSKSFVNVLLVAGFVLFVFARVRYVNHRQAQAEAEAFPVGAVAFLSQQPSLGPILNHYNWGGYFIWKLYPRYHVFIDGRTDLYGDSLMDMFATTYYLRGNAWRDALQRWGIRTVVLPPDAPMLAALRLTPGWKQIYADSQAVILSDEASGDERRTFSGNFEHSSLDLNPPPSAKL